MATYKQLDTAYKSAIKNKRKNPAFVDFDIHRCRNILRLQKSLKEHTLQPHASAYIVRKPVIREVFSADMDMCILAHWLVSYIRPEMEKVITDRIFNNRVGKGLDKALEQIVADIHEVSNSCTIDCYHIVCDIKGYFPNANQERAYKMLESLLKSSDDAQRDICELIYALNNAIYFDKKNIVRVSPLCDWGLLKPSKSVLEKPDGVGAFPGEMIMQMAMTYYCNPIYKWLETLNVRFVVYGDDAEFCVRDKDRFLRYVLPEYRKRMLEIGCTIHPQKFYVQHYTKGARFCSQSLKIGRIYAGNRTKNNYYQKVAFWNKRCGIQYINHMLASMNSYLGFMKHRNGYAIMRKGYESLSDKWKQYVALDMDKNILVALPEYNYNSVIAKLHDIKLKNLTIIKNS